MNLLFKILLVSATLLSSLSVKAEGSEEDVRCLTENIYFEARSESIAGWMGVADVTLNRASSKRFPNSICEVVFQGVKHKGSGMPIKNKCQFSWYCDGKPDYIANLDMYSKISYFVRAGMGANTFRFDITDGATHYHHYTINPSWAKNMTKTVRIDEHIFYRVGPKERLKWTEKNTKEAVNAEHSTLFLNVHGD